MPPPDGTDAPITARRLFAWWPFVFAILVCAGGYFGFDKRLSKIEDAQTAAALAAASTAADMKEIGKKYESLLAKQAEVGLSLSLEQKRDNEKGNERMSAIEKGIARIEGRLYADRTTAPAAGPR